jgi:CPA2 family monovalent cation:H+ antiporter-2
VQKARDSRYRFLRGYFHGADDHVEFDDEAHARLHSVAVEPGAAAVGRTLGALALHDIGAEVTAVRRRGIRGDDPSAELTLQAGDVLVLRGPQEALEMAELRLSRK